jgi:hypothetical protein
MNANQGRANQNNGIRMIRPKEMYYYSDPIILILPTANFPTSNDAFRPAFPIRVIRGETKKAGGKIPPALWKLLCVTD